MFRPPLAVLINASRETARAAEAIHLRETEEVRDAGHAVDVIAIIGHDDRIRFSEFHVRFDRAWLSEDDHRVEVLLNGHAESALEMSVDTTRPTCVFASGQTRPSSLPFGSVPYLRPGPNQLLFRLPQSQIQVEARLFVWPTDAKVRQASIRDHLWTYVFYMDKNKGVPENGTQSYRGCG